MVQILQIAEDAEIRAAILDLMASSLDAARDEPLIPTISRPARMDRRVDSLREIAGDLRSVAEKMVDRWAGPDRTS